MRVLTFLSDFGRTSPYPAAMKVVAAAICDAALVDISHDVPPQAVRIGAYLLWSVVPACPLGTVHCAVVDPGVGTTRAALAVAAGGQIFVGPDNGLLIPAARRAGQPVAYRLTDPAYWRHPVSATFHGRDVFAPAAAHAAAGVPLETMGVRADPAADLALPAGRWEGGQLVGEVLWVDPFGNLITSVPGALLGRLPPDRPVVVQAGPGSLRAVVARTFGEAPPGEALVLAGSDDLVEVVLNRGSAAARTGAGPGATVSIRPV